MYSHCLCDSLFKCVYIGSCNCEDVFATLYTYILYTLILLAVIVHLYSEEAANYATCYAKIVCAM